MARGWPAGTNEDVRTGGGWLQLGRRVRPVPGDHCIVGKSPQGSRQAEYQALNLSGAFTA
jgi:hypothetical protein